MAHAAPSAAKRLTVLIVTGAVLIMQPTSVNSKTLAEWKRAGTFCEDNSDQIRKLWAVNSTENALRDPRPAMNAYKKLQPYMETCTVGDTQIIASHAYKLALLGAIFHRGNDSNWEDAMNQANQLFARCESMDYGGIQGSQCETDLGINTRRKIEWTAQAMQK
jgi:hypothetical protein